MPRRLAIFSFSMALLAASAAQAETPASELPSSPQPAQEQTRPPDTQKAPAAAPPTIPATTTGPCVVGGHETPPPVTLKLRVICLTQTNFSIGAVITPAVSAALIMANPPDNYPRDWKDGAEAFGHNYGDRLARNATSGITHFTIATLDREDPRYYASDDKRIVHRAFHALLFTIVDKTQSGHSTLALSNFAGATASGFVGMAYMPRGYDDVAHGYQHAAIEFGSFGAQNLAAEFYPEIAKVARKFHLPYPRR